jgi:uncharacterized protein (TIGR02284 family)
MINDYEARHDITDENFKTATDATGSNAAATNDEVISTLNNLIETCRDGQNGFQEAAEGVKDSSLKSLFYEYSRQRAQFVGELQSLVRDLGAEPQTSGSVAAAVHRGWINIKSAVTGQDDAAILNECERGEDVAKNVYQEALAMNLPSNVASVIQSQAQAVQEAHDRVKALRNAANSTGTSSTAGGGY